MGFRSLHVINDDRVEAGKGFGEHPHHDAEIFSYVIDGELEHKDSMGNGRVIKAGDLQYISAGRGIFHSEFNPSKKSPVHFLQIWIVPQHRGGEPSYEQKSFSEADKQGDLLLVASADGREGSLRIDQDTHIFASKLLRDDEIHLPLEPVRRYWLQVARGEIQMGEQTLRQGDGVGLRTENRLQIRATEDSELLLLDLA